jgi:hypothetical protein
MTRLISHRLNRKIALRKSAQKLTECIPGGTPRFASLHLHFQIGFQKKFKFEN